MKTLFFKSLPSTQTHLKELLKKGEVVSPLAVVADTQTQGLGSRNNSWVSLQGNLFLSFAIPLKHLPEDLKLASASIYFSYLLQETLNSYGSKVILKWPNDLYIDNSKVGGMITNLVGENLVCGLGLNILNESESFKCLDVKISRKNLLESYFRNIEKSVLWKQVFSKYKLNFQTNKNFFTHVNGVKVSLSDATLEEDGSLNINGQKVYSLR